MGGTLVGYDDRERFPLKCYDAGNHFMSQWFNSNTRYVDNGGYERTVVRLAAFTDYGLIPLDPWSYSILVVIANTKIVMQYNRRKAHNIDTNLHVDEVVIIDASSADRNTFVAGLKSRRVSPYESVYNSYATGRIEICDLTVEGAIDYALVSVSEFNGPSMCPY
jgi:hypothetical protein